MLCFLQCVLKPYKCNTILPDATCVSLLHKRYPWALMSWLNIGFQKITVPFKRHTKSPLGVRPWRKWLVCFDAVVLSFCDLYALLFIHFFPFSSAFYFLFHLLLLRSSFIFPLEVGHASTEFPWRLRTVSTYGK